MSGEGVLSSRGGAAAPQPALRTMLDAPKTGERVLVWVRHANWKYARATDDDADRWEGFVIANWTEFNGGGWTWHGHCGEFLGWLPLPVPDLDNAAGEVPQARSSAASGQQ